MLCVLSIRQFLSARHPLGSFVEYLTNPMKLTDLHEADRSYEGRVRPVLTSCEVKILHPLEENTHAENTL